jgi:hypothetical protein
VCVCVCVCVCACVKERETKRERQRERDRDRESVKAQRKGNTSECDTACCLSPILVSGDPNSQIRH